MPVVDTEVLFALNPRDPNHSRALKILKSGNELVVADSALIEFQLVLRGRGRTPQETREALLAVGKILAEHGVKEVNTINSSRLALQCEIESRQEISYFDSLIATSALALDGKIVSDDRAFDRIAGLVRIPLKT